jgi:hypothetical protein
MHSSLYKYAACSYQNQIKYKYSKSEKIIDIFSTQILPWFQRFIFIVFIAKGRGKINLWLKAAMIQIKSD